MKISASLLFFTGGESARLRRDAQYRNYQAQLNQFDQFDDSYGAKDLAYFDNKIKPIRNQDLFNNVDLYNSNLDLFNADNDVDAGYATDFVFDGSRNEYYPIDITQGDNYGNSVQYQALGRIDDSADEWIDDDLLSTSSMSSRTYGSRDRTFDILDDEDDDEDLFGDDLNLIDDDDEEELENELAMDLALNVIQNELENKRVVDNALGYALGQLDADDIFDDDEEDNDDLMFESDLFDDEEDEDEDDSVNDLMNEIRILDLVDELDSRQL